MNEINAVLRPCSEAGAPEREFVTVSGRKFGRAGKARPTIVFLSQCLRKIVR